MKSVVLSNNRFSEKGIGQLISKREKTNLSLDVLDLSNCNLCDAALEKLAVLVDCVRELVLTDNNFTR